MTPCGDVNWLLANTYAFLATMLNVSLEIRRLIFYITLSRPRTAVLKSSAVTSIAKCGRVDKA